MVFSWWKTYSELIYQTGPDLLLWNKKCPGAEQKVLEGMCPPPSVGASSKQGVEVLVSLSLSGAAAALAEVEECASRAGRADLAVEEQSTVCARQLLMVPFSLCLLFSLCFPACCSSLSVMCSHGSK